MLSKLRKYDAAGLHTTELCPSLQMTRVTLQQGLRRGKTESLVQNLAHASLHLQTVVTSSYQEVEHSNFVNCIMILNYTF